MTMQTQASAREVVVFRSAALGDFILATPALAAVRKEYPGRRVVLLTTTSASKEQRERVAAYAGNAPSLQRGLPWTQLATPHLIDETIVVPELASWQGMRLARNELRNRDIECGLMLLDPASPYLGRFKKWLMLKFVTRSAPLFGWRAKGSFLRKRDQLLAQGLLGHHALGPLQFLREIKPPRPPGDVPLRFDLRPDAAATAWADDWVRSHALGRRLVALAPGSIQPHKRWPLQRFEQLCSALLQRHADLTLVVLGTPADQELGSQLCTLDAGRVLNLAGRSSIAQSAALLKRVSLLVGNDGGAMHLGDAMGARVVSIVPGLEYPDSIEPWHNRHRAVRHPVPCAPCYSFDKCPQSHNACMLELPVERVLEQCLLALSEAGPLPLSIEPRPMERQSQP